MFFLDSSRGLNVQAKEFVPQAQEQIRAFRQATHNFSNGHYILLTDKIEFNKHVASLAHVPWLVIFDFDPSSSDKGLLNRLKGGITKHRYVHELTWNGESHITERSTNWIVMMETESQYQVWRKKVLDSLRKHVINIREFCKGLSTLTTVVLWPDDNGKWKHFKYMIIELTDIVSTEVVIIKNEHSEEIQEITDLKDEVNAQVLRLSYEELSNVIQADCKTDIQSNSEYKLPTYDERNNPDLTAKEMVWLREALDVLYIDEVEEGRVFCETNEREEHDFRRGGTLSWSWWYTYGPGAADIERDIHEKIVSRIDRNHIKIKQSGIVAINHFPGSGGTTLGQRVLWDLRKTAPCAQIRHESVLADSSTKDTSERIYLLQRKTQLPVVLLVDGEDDQWIEELYKMLSDDCCIVLIVIKRCWQKLEKEDSGNFYLDKYISKREGRLLYRLVKNDCSDENKQALDDLYSDHIRGKDTSIIEFGLAAYDYKYTGIQGYVRGYLRLDANKRPTVWQQALAYLSLVYYYGQSNIPCKTIGSFLAQKTDSFFHDLTSFKNFPDEFSEFLVAHDADKRFVRISHFLVAKEILDQFLTHSSQAASTKIPSSALSTDAKLSLADFSVEFIKTFAGIHQSRRMATLMQRTFIKRLRGKAFDSEHQKIPEINGQGFALILKDASSTPPFMERFEIMETLVECFPKEAQFHAHLGRLYSICRPEKVLLAEECFKRALEVNSEQEDISEISMKINQMHIYHMYGSMYLKRVRSLTDVNKFKQDTESSALEKNEDKLLSEVEKACEMFTKCREVSPSFWKDSHGYRGELKVRLRFCQFAKCQCRGNSLGTYMKKIPKSKTVKFLEESFITLNQLVDEWARRFETNSMDEELRAFQQQIACLFSKQEFVEQEIPNDIHARRYIVACIKSKYREACHPIENIQDLKELAYVLQTLKLNIKESKKRNACDRKLIDQEHKDWMCAIRHPKLEEVYTIDNALQVVNCWYEMTKSRDSVYYKFVLNSVLAFQCLEKMEPARYLREANILKKGMVQNADNPRRPREWLGQHKDTNNVRNIVCASTKISFSKEKTVDITGKNVRILTGKICKPNDKRFKGKIEMKLEKDSTDSIIVHFSPNKTKEMLCGEQNSNEEVEFVLGFSMTFGYEAFNVKRLLKATCPSCQLQVRKRSVDINFVCQGCSCKFNV